MALVLVLFALILVSVLAVAFFVAATTDRKSSALYHEQGAAKRLSDTAVNTVIAQIRAATTSGASASGGAWASQPGAIRCYNSSGNFTSGYKLYSAATMVETTEANMATNDLPPANWQSQPALYTDLNSPVRSSAGHLTFPIIDGNGMVASSGNLTYGNATTPAGATVPAVAGFSINATSLTYNAAQALSSTNTPVPMPVMWHYLLQDGRIVVPTGNGSVAGATTANPIVGRIAFWTDDECSKVNVNTASYDSLSSTVNATTGGDLFTSYHAYQSQPFCEGPAERQLAMYQPAKDEVQRFPGHPATTSLSGIFPTLSPADIFHIVPRVVSGGSLGGTGNATAAITYDTNRLYPTVGELLYSPNMSGGDRTANSSLNGTLIERARFFATSRSRAPELNLFGKPRVAIWPVHETDSNKYRTAFDQLIAFCSSLSGVPYYFTRRDSTSPTVDLTLGNNVNLFGNASGTSYLQILTGTSIPGFGGSFSSKYGADRDQILTEIEDYIRSSNLSDPLLFDVGGQYTVQNPSTTTEELSSNPGHRQVAPLFNADNNTMGIGRFATVTSVALHIICTADGSEGTFESPITPYPSPMPNPTPASVYKQMSNYASSSNVTTVHYGNGTTGTITAARNLTLALNTPLALNERRVEAVLRIKTEGLDAAVGNMTITVDGLQGFQLGAANLGFPNSGTLVGNDPLNSQRAKNFSGRYLGARGVMPADTSTPIGLYPFVGAPITVTSNSTTAPFSGGNLTINVYSGTSANPANLTQTIQVSFPPCDLPIPKLVTEKFIDATGSFYSPQTYWTFSRDGVGIPGDLFNGSNGTTSSVTGGRLKTITGSPYMPAMRFPEDTLKGLSVAHGDYRLTGATRDVSTDKFATNKDYSNSSEAFGGRFYETGAKAGQAHQPPSNFEPGRLVATGNYNFGFSISPPSAPGSTEFSSLPSTVNRPWTFGDWDNGTARDPDGAFINRPDEGQADVGDVPYFPARAGTSSAIDGTMASPNRIMPSPVMFGSLPTGVKADKAWRTLLFRPYYPADVAGASSHPGATSPADSLLLDLFWMPVVEPYAISETFSTAGKINMNFQILPFSYIKRDTGLRAVLASERVIAIPSPPSPGFTKYKDPNYLLPPCRYPIDLDKTLRQFDLKFGRNEIFKSATEICALDLIPKGVSPAITVNGIGNNMAAFWLANRLTGDNAKERPYAGIYPRLTTKSNTYQVHYRVQSLKKTPNTPEGVFVDPASAVAGAKDVILSDLRGSAIIERYLDPTDTFPNYTTDSVAAPLDNYYKYRVVAGREFLP